MKYYFLLIRDNIDKLQIVTFQEKLNDRRWKDDSRVLDCRIDVRRSV